MAHAPKGLYVVERHGSIMVPGRTCLWYRMRLSSDVQTSPRKAEAMRWKGREVCSFAKQECRCFG